MLNKTIIIVQFIVLMFLYQTPTFAHFINSELDEKPESAIETENEGYSEGLKISSTSLFS